MLGKIFATDILKYFIWTMGFNLSCKLNLDESHATIKKKKKKGREMASPSSADFVQIVLKVKSKLQVKNYFTQGCQQEEYAGNIFPQKQMPLYLLQENYPGRQC